METFEDHGNSSFGLPQNASTGWGSISRCEICLRLRHTCMHMHEWKITEDRFCFALDLTKNFNVRLFKCVVLIVGVFVVSNREGNYQNLNIVYQLTETD